MLVADYELNMRAPRFHSPTLQPRPHLLAVLLLLTCFVPLSGCKDAQDVSQAVETLKLREEKVGQREAVAVVRDRELFERERQLAATQQSLDQQVLELENQKKALDAEIEKLKDEKEAILLKERRGPAPKVAAQRVIVIDPRTNEVLMEKNADAKEQVASTQKLLTALLVTEKGNLDGMLTVEGPDTICAPVRFGLKAGEQYSRRQLLTTLMVKSSNDIAQALARDNAGSLEAFAAKMNARAKELGMKNSHFVNPNGLPAEEQYSTARDMSLVAKAVDLLPDVRTMINTKVYNFKKMDGSTVTLENTNRVLRNYAYCDGMKTGYTQAAGFCLIASGEKEGRRRIVVVLNDTRYDVWKDSQALLEWALKS